MFSIELLSNKGLYIQYERRNNSAGISTKIERIVIIHVSVSIPFGTIFQFTFRENIVDDFLSRNDSSSYLTNLEMLEKRKLRSRDYNIILAVVYVLDGPLGYVQGKKSKNRWQPVADRGEETFHWQQCRQRARGPGPQEQKNLDLEHGMWVYKNVAAKKKIKLKFCLTLLAFQQNNSNLPLHFASIHFYR